MYNNILIRENYFENPGKIRNIALSLEYESRLEKKYPHKGWRGKRTHSLDFYNNNYINYYSEKIFNLCYDYFDLGNYIHPDLKKSPINPVLISYFHINVEKDKECFPDYFHDKFHQDDACYVAGVVYLTPNPVINAGTSIFDDEINQVVEIDNIYNRLVAFESSKIHAPSNFFGFDDQTGRMTYNFFILESKHLGCDE